RAVGPDPGAGPARCRHEPLADPGARRRPAGPDPTAGRTGRPAPAADAEGARRAAGGAGVTRRRGHAGRAAGPGRDRRRHAQGGGARAAPQARRTVGDRHRGRPRLPAGMIMGLRFRTRLTVMITGLVGLAGLLLLGIEYVIVTQLFRASITTVPEQVTEYRPT